MQVAALILEQATASYFRSAAPRKQKLRWVVRDTRRKSCARSTPEQQAGDVRGGSRRPRAYLGPCRGAL